MYNALVALFDAKKIKKEVCVSNNSNNGEECKNLRRNFNIYYPEVSKIISKFGIDIMYPLEIMDMGIDENKREYSVYINIIEPKTWNQYMSN